MAIFRHIGRWWSRVVPVVAVVLLGLFWGREVPVAGSVIAALGLIAAVLTAVHHAEVVAHRVGEPFGSVVLAVAVTVIEVGLIVMLMAADPVGNTTLARDSVFAVVMMTMNGVVGLSLLVAASRHGRRGMAVFNSEGAGSALGAVILLVGLTLILPRYTTSATGLGFSPAQLGFVGVASLAVYVLFVFTQTVQHRNFFLPPKPVTLKTTAIPESVVVGMAPTTVTTPAVMTPTAVMEAVTNAAVTNDSTTVAMVSVTPGLSDDDDDLTTDPPTNGETWLSVAMLLISLVAVVGLAKVENAAIKSVVDYWGFPSGVVGVVIALLVLLPESIAAVKAALRNRAQISLNLAYGSAMASIGLTIPVLALLSIWMPGRLSLGLGPVDIALFTISVGVSILTVVPGRAKPLHGGLHLALFATFIFLTFVP
ncbi:MAG: ionic transporter y4hA [Propionibacteriaceae bacterium]|nr:ionic transporter y4hA [Propionibacteriaceae bacterium]